MPKEKKSIMRMIKQVFPVHKQVPLERLYLDQRLLNVAAWLGRSVVLSDYLTDQNGVIAKATEEGRFEIPAALRNPSDWQLYQELMAQADVIISGGSYFKRLATSQDILYPFEPGNAFEKLGQWRLNAGYKRRSPDVAIVTRDLDFRLPEKLAHSGRRIVIFTTNSVASSDRAKALRNAKINIVSSGDAGVDGGNMIATLGDQMGYRVIMMASGPNVLKLLMTAKCLDLLYITEAQVKIPFYDPASVQTMLLEGKTAGGLQDFHLAHQFTQEHVAAEDGSVISQSFLRYDRNEL